MVIIVTGLYLPTFSRIAQYSNIMVYLLLLISLAVLLTLMSTADIDEKSHDFWLIKMDKPELNPDWLTNLSYKLKRINKYGKALDLNVTLMKDIDNDDVMCQGKIFQKHGGKYVKAPFDLPEMACCKLMENNELIWPCIQESSNFPKKCPITKGVIQMEDFNPNACNNSKQFPPNQPEDYRGVFIGTVNSVQIWKYVVYIQIKKKMEIV